MTTNINKLFIIVAMVVASCFATNYFVDGVGGNDANTGLSDAQAEKTLGALPNGATLNAGDTIFIKKNSVFILSSGYSATSTDGEPGNPIVYKSYGTGALPIISDTSANGYFAFRVYGDNVVVDGLRFRDTKTNGLEFYNGSSYNIVQNCEVDSCGYAIYVNGDNCGVYNNYLHDGIMIRNDAGANNDYGANGVLVAKSYCEIAFNTIIGMRKPSIDYGTDGGAVEFYGAKVDSVWIHHNEARDCNGFLEIGSDSGVCLGTRVYRNLSVNNYPNFMAVHTDLDGCIFNTTIDSICVYNNTIIDTLDWKTGDDQWELMGAHGAFTAEQLEFRNNIVRIADYRQVMDTSQYNSTLTHENNLYSFLHAATVTGYGFDATEDSASPGFIDQLGANYRLADGSPAINTGVAVGDSLDGDYLPTVGIPDIGLYEYQDTGTPYVPEEVTIYVPTYATNIGTSFDHAATISDTVSHDTISGTASIIVATLTMQRKQKGGDGVLTYETITGDGADSVSLLVSAKTYDKNGNFLYTVNVDTIASATGGYVNVPTLPGSVNEILLTGLTGNGGEVILNRMYFYRRK